MDAAGWLRRFMVVEWEGEIMSCKKKFDRNGIEVNESHLYLRQHLSRELSFLWIKVGHFPGKLLQICGVIFSSIVVDLSAVPYKVAYRFFVFPRKS
jgi:hypothetical protein